MSTFGDTSAWTDEDHARANAERERDLAALREEEPQEGPGRPVRDEATVAYLEGLEDGQRAAYAMQVRQAAARRALVVRGIREGALYGAAWAAGYLLAEWLRGNLGGAL